MTKNIKNEALFVYCPTCGEEGCCIAEPEGSDLEWEVVLYWSCENTECTDCGKDLEPSKEYWENQRKQEELFLLEEEEFFAEIANKSPEQIVEENWPEVEHVGMDADVTAELREVRENFDC